MADVLKITIELTHTPGTTTTLNKPQTEKPDSLSITMTGTNFLTETQEINITTAESITKGEIGTLGWCLIYNLDSTNFVEIGDADESYTIKILAGEFALFRASDPLFGEANTAVVTIRKVFFEL